MTLQRLYKDEFKGFRHSLRTHGMLSVQAFLSIFDNIQRVYMSSGFSLSVRSSHSLFFTLTYPAAARIAAFLWF